MPLDDYAITHIETDSPLDENWVSGSSVDSTEPVTLHLAINDPVILEALRSRAEGRARDHFAEQALRIGVLAIQSATGQIDSDKVRNEGDRLIEKLASTVETYRTRTSDEIEGILKNYFNPEDGRFTENVGRLVKQDGELQTLLKNHVTTSQREMQQTINQLVGPESPIARLLNPGDANRFFEHLKTVTSSSIDAQNQAILKQFSLDVEDSALRRLLGELKRNHTDVGSNLQTHITEVMREFSLDHEESALNRMLRQIQDASTQISSQFTLDNDESALSRVRKELKELIENLNSDTRSFQDRIALEINSIKTRREESMRGVQHGHDFEADVISTIRDLFNGSGDEIESVGTTTGAVRASRKGDAVITLSPDSAAPGARIVIEAKEAEGYTISMARKELEEARENRLAQYGVFVVSAKLALAKEIEPLCRYDYDIVVVWDAQDKNSDLALKAAILLAKGLVVRAARETEGVAADLGEIDKAMSEVNRQLEGMNDVTRWAETITNSSEKIISKAKSMRERIERKLQVIAEQVDSLRPNS